MPSRRHVLGSISAVGATSLAGCIGSQDTDSGTTTDYKWPTEGGDHRNSRAVPDGVAPREEPTVEWRTDLRSSLANGEPIVTNSTVLVNTGRDILAIDRETAERRWSIDPDNRPFRYSGAPAVLDGTVYAPEERTLTARSIASGGGSLASRVRPHLQPEFPRCSRAQRWATSVRCCWEYGQSYRRRHGRVAVGAGN